MDEKLENISQRYESVCARMEAPEIYSDPAAYAALAREQKELQPVAAGWQTLCRLRQEETDARELLRAETDPDLRELVREELSDLTEKLQEQEQALRLLLLPKDPDDGRPVIMEIRAGVGGEESALFAHSLFRMYSMYGDRQGWKIEIANVSDTELGGIKELTAIIEGDNAWSRLKFEGGVHRVQRVPETETQGRVHTSTVTVAVLPEAEETEVELDMSQLRIDVFRSSGAGGQKVNKTSSAIRVTHLPTGMVVECQDERSQFQNKARALSILASRLADIERQKKADERADNRRSQVGTGMRNERIRTYNFPQGRVTDHRIGLTLYRIDSIMDGDLDELTGALIADERARRLQEETL